MEAEEETEDARITCQSAEEAVDGVVEVEVSLEEQAEGEVGLKFQSRRQRWICEILNCVSQRYRS